MLILEWVSGWCTISAAASLTLTQVRKIIPPVPITELLKSKGTDNKPIPPCRYLVLPPLILSIDLSLVSWLKGEGRVHYRKPRDVMVTKDYFSFFFKSTFSDKSVT